MHSPIRTCLALADGVLAVALVAAACSSGSTNHRAAPATSTPPTVSPTDAATKQATLRTDIRKLWEDHITWTRLYVISAEAGSPDTDATAQRLPQNQTDIGDAIKPLYGDAAGAQLTALLPDHILTAGQADRRGQVQRHRQVRHHRGRLVREGRPDCRLPVQGQPRPLAGHGGAPDDA
jgi:hypothetical protein